MKKLLTLALSSLLASYAYADDTAVREAVATLAPDVTIDSIKPAPFDGFSEVLLGAQLIYVSNDGKYLVDGQVIEMATRRNLSEASKSVVRQNLMQEMAAEDRIVYSPDGEVKHSVAVFTDIDCGYCRRLHQQMDEYNDLGIEISYLLFPRAGIGSESWDKAVSVWCSDDKETALTAAKAGEDPGQMTCSNPIEAQYELGRQLGVSGTPSIMLEDGTMLPGYVPPTSLLQRLDAESAG